MNINDKNKRIEELQRKLINVSHNCIDTSAWVRSKEGIEEFSTACYIFESVLKEIEEIKILFNEMKINKG